MNKIYQKHIANIISWRVSQGVYHNTNHIVTECIVTPLLVAEVSLVKWPSWARFIEKHQWFCGYIVSNQLNAHAIFREMSWKTLCKDTRAIQCCGKPFLCVRWIFIIIPLATKLGGYIGFSLSVCLSVRLSVCLSVCPLTFCVRPVASTVPDGFFPYLVQMITSMRRCVACDDLWPWPISSRSFDLDLENCVSSVASTFLDGFLIYLAQMITIIRGCVACYVFFKIWKFEFLANF